MNAGRCRNALAALSLALLLCCGCGRSTARRPLHGRVEIAGVAVSRGSISLLPAAGNSGPAANAVILDGEYRFTGASGPHAGPHRVLIDIDARPGADQKTGKGAPGDVKRVDLGTANAAAERRPPSPAEVAKTTKRHWEVEYTVPESGECRKDFELEE